MVSRAVGHGWFSLIVIFFRLGGVCRFVDIFFFVVGGFASFSGRVRDKLVMRLYFKCSLYKS